MSRRNKLIIIILVFLAAYFIPFRDSAIQKALIESFLMLQDYARKHIILCLIPAFFIAGAIGVFLSQGSVMKYLGAKANKFVSYSVASVSGSILAVCSCTVLPLFTGIYRMGAGIGPATAFLYSGPAINIMAIVLTAKVLGFEIGIARAVGAIIFAVIIGLLMAVTFRHEEHSDNEMVVPEDDAALSGKKNAIFFFVLVAILVFANWAKPGQPSGFFHIIYTLKWYLTGLMGLILSILLVKWFNVKWFIMFITGIITAALAILFGQYPLLAFSAAIVGVVIGLMTAEDRARTWLDESGSFAFQILPLLLGGIMIAGFLLGMPGSGNGIIPHHWVASLVGGNSLGANFFASIVGAFMYFATLTEVPILQGLLSAGMGKGPALALLLAGPALSLPNMLVIRSVLGNKKTIVFVAYVVILSTIAGMIFGYITS